MSDELKELTQQLPEFPIAETDIAGLTHHDVECGTCLSWALHPTATDEDAASAALFFNSTGVFQEHQHTEREWIVVIKGSMLFVKSGEETRLLPGMSVVNEPGELHSARFIEDCWYYAITVPRCEGWPQ